MDHLVLHRMPWAELEHKDPAALLTREWLVTNGLGGYASGSISGACTRRYHGLLISALSAPWGRMVMLNHLAEELRLPDGTIVRLGGEERSEDEHELPGITALSEFRLETGLPVWSYRTESFVLEKRLLFPYRSNTVHLSYRLLEGDGRVRLGLRPSVHFRPHEDPVDRQFEQPYTVVVVGDRFEIHAADLPRLRLFLHSPTGAFVHDRGRFRQVFYRVEYQRGYESLGTLWSPGYFRVTLEPGEDATLLASTDDWDSMLALDPQEARAAELERRHRLIAQAAPGARSGVGAELVLAADQFIITPTRPTDAARARAAGDEARTVIAGYHWFTDWGRDTMISLEGLTLTTGRTAEAGYILRTFNHYVRDGLIPNMFPEGQRDGLYHTADATLWFFHALDRFVHATGDRGTLLQILPTLFEIVNHHLKGTHFGIRIDPNDGLLTQGQEDYQLTWMDAKVDGWVVTPRRGKAVELNALWYNALRLLEGWAQAEGYSDKAGEIRGHAEKCKKSFNERFWIPHAGSLYDIVDGQNGNDSAIRPNQVFAISLTHPVLDQAYWRPVMDVVTERLLTPMGLRTLAPGHPDYKPRYYGDLRSRDAAYHQGTVWAWLVGPFIDAWEKTYPDNPTGASAFFEGFIAHLGEACIGSISEIFDAEAPYTPRGCIAQAWSIAEVLRCWARVGPPQSSSR